MHCFFKSAARSTAGGGAGEGDRSSTNETEKESSFRDNPVFFILVKFLVQC